MGSPTIAQEPASSTLLTYEEVAAIMRVSIRTVKRHVARKNLRSVDLGHKTKRFRRVDVERCVANLAGARTPEF